jgi:hypothetical protein
MHMKPFFLALALALPVRSSDLVLHDTPVQVFFSPHGGCQDAVVHALAGARKAVIVQAYSSPASLSPLP